MRDDPKGVSAPREHHTPNSGPLLTAWGVPQALMCLLWSKHKASEYGGKLHLYRESGDEDMACSWCSEMEY